MKRIHGAIVIVAGLQLAHCASAKAQNETPRASEPSRAARWIQSVDERITALQAQHEQLAAADRSMRDAMTQLAGDLAFVAGELGAARADLSAIMDIDPAQRERLAVVSERLAEIESRLLEMNARFVRVETSEQPPVKSDGNRPIETTTRPLAAVIAATGERDALTRAARTLIDKAAGDRIATRVYLSRSVDPTRTFTFDAAAVRNHIAEHAPPREEGCLFVVDLEGEYFRALRSGDEELIEKAVNLYVQAVRTAKEARPGEPVMVYGIPNQNWTRYDLTMFDPVFAEVDYMNVSAYAGNDKTDARYRERIDESFAISEKIARRFGLEYVAHVNPRYKDGTRVPMDEFIDGMQHLKSKGVEHVVYWQAPWRRITDLAADGKPMTVSDATWQAAVEQCYICALLKVFDPENPVSKTCSTTLPGAPN